MKRKRKYQPAVREGLVIGGVLGALLVLNAVLINVVQLGAGGYLTIVPCIGAYLLAGVRAAKGAGGVELGLLAGGLTGLSSSLISAAGTLVVVYTQVERIRQTVQAEAGPAVTYTNEQIIAQRSLGVVAGLVLATAVGLGVGAVGGLRGRQH